MPRQFSLAYLTVPGIDPVKQIKIAKKAGYDYVSLRTIPMGQTGEPQVHLENDPELTEQVRQTLKDYEMKLFDIELLRIREDLPTDYRAAFEKGAELGATQVLTSVWTKDHSLAVDRYGSGSSVWPDAESGVPNRIRIDYHAASYGTPGQGGRTQLEDPDGYDLCLQDWADHRGDSGGRSQSVWRDPSV